MKTKQLPKRLSGPITSEYFSVEQASEYLGMRLATVRNYLTSSKLTTYKFLTLTLVSRAEVKKMKKRRSK